MGRLRKVKSELTEEQREGRRLASREASRRRRARMRAELGPPKKAGPPRFVPAQRTLAEMIEDEVRTRDRSTGCWVWPAFRDHDGYGQVFAVGRKTSPHRYAFYLTHGGVWPVQVRHTCDNGPGGCYNPDHCINGTSALNSRDMVERGRSLRGERHPHVRLTAVEVVEMRRLDAAGVTVAEIRAAVRAVSPRGVEGDSGGDVGGRADVL